MFVLRSVVGYGCFGDDLPGEICSMLVYTNSGCGVLKFVEHKI